MTCQIRGVAKRGSAVCTLMLFNVLHGTLKEEHDLRKPAICAEIPFTLQPKTPETTKTEALRNFEKTLRAEKHSEP